MTRCCWEFQIPTWKHYHTRTSYWPWLSKLWCFTKKICFFKAYENASGHFAATVSPRSFRQTYKCLMTILYFSLPCWNELSKTLLKNLYWKELLTLYNTVAFKRPCKNFPYYVIKLYTRIWLFYTLKFANTNFKIPNRNRNTFRRQRFSHHFNLIPWSTELSWYIQHLQSTQPTYLETWTLFFCI